MTPEDHLSMMRNPSRWPNRILPVKNIERRDKQGFSLLGYMIRNGRDEAIPMVLLGNIFFPPTDNKFLESEDFSSLEAVIAAGWRVD